MYSEQAYKELRYLLERSRADIKKNGLNYTNSYIFLRCIATLNKIFLTEHLRLKHIELKVQNSKKKIVSNQKNNTLTLIEKMLNNTR